MRKRKNKRTEAFVLGIIFMIYVILKLWVSQTPAVEDDAIPDAILKMLATQT